MFNNENQIQQIYIKKNGFICDTSMFLTCFSLKDLTEKLHIKVKKKSQRRFIIGSLNYATTFCFILLF